MVRSDLVMSLSLWQIWSRVRNMRWRAMVLLVIVSCGPRRGDSFVSCRGVHTASGKVINGGGGGMHQLVTSAG